MTAVTALLLVPCERYGGGTDMEHRPDAEVLWIVPKAWEDELTVIVMRSITVAAWRRIVDDGGMTVAVEPESRIVGGPAAGGHVVRVDGEDGLHYFALPLPALPALWGLVSDAAYDRLLADAEEEE